MKITWKTEVADEKDFHDLVGKYMMLITSFYQSHPEKQKRIVGVSLEDTLHWMAAALAVFQCDAALCPLEKKESCIDVEIDFVIDSKVSEVTEALEVVPFKDKIGDILLHQGENLIRISGTQLKKWLEFNQDTLKITGNRAVLVIRNKQELASMFWIQSLISYCDIIITNQLKPVEESADWFLAEELVTDLIKFPNINSCTIVTVGEEEILLEEIKDYLLTKQIRWYHYFAFPYENWLGAGREILVQGEQLAAQEIRPLPGNTVRIVKEDGSQQRSKLPGIVKVENDFEHRETDFNGILLDNKMYILKHRQAGRYCHGLFLSKKEVEDALYQIDAVADFYVKGENIYYVEKEILNAGCLEEELRNYLPEQAFPFRFYKIPYVPMTQEGIVDEKELIKIAVHANLQIESSEKMNIAINAAFDNMDQGLAVFEKVSEKKNVQLDSEKDAYVELPPIDYTQLTVQTLPELLKKRSCEAQRIVYVGQDGKKEESYGMLYKNARKIANGLRKAGILPGEKLILQLPKNQQYLEAFWGCMLAGIVPAPLAVLDDYGVQNLNTDKLLNICKLLDMPYILTSNLYEERIGQLHESVLCFEKISEHEEIAEDAMYFWKPEEVTMIMFTSGSTGIPKGVMLTHKNIFARTLGEIDLYKMNENEIDVNWMTLTHAAGLVWTNIRDIYLNCLQVQVQSEYILDCPIRWLELLNDYQATITWAPNFAYSMLNEELDASKEYGWNLSHLKYMFATAEANVSKTLRGFLEKLSIYHLSKDVIKPCFGMTETASVMIYYNQFDYNSTSDEDEFVPIGTPVKGHTFRIVDEEGNLCREGEIGYIQGKGDTITPGYYKNEEANADSFTSDGYFITGDLGYLIDGTITLTGRQKDIIIINGLNYYVQDIESVVDEISGVHASYTVATSVKNSKGEEEILILFSPIEEEILEEDQKLMELIEIIKKTVREKCNVFPTYIIPVSYHRSIRTELGKKQRNKYRQAFAAGEYDTIIHRLGMDRKNTQSVLKEVWYPCPIKGTLFPQTPLTILVADDGVKNEVRAVFKDAAIVTIQEVKEEQLNTPVLIDFLPLQTKCTQVTEFAKQALLHAKFWGKQTHVNRIYVVGECMNQFAGDTKWNEASGILRGLVKSFNIEYPDKHCRLLDFDVLNMDRLMNEIRARGETEEIAYRNGIRYGSYFRTVAAEEVRNKTLDWEKKVCVITGGTGGIGRKLALHLAKKYQVRLILLGQTGITEEKQKLLDKLKRFTTGVVYLQADVSNAMELSRAIEAGEQQLGHKAELFFHLAGKISASQKQNTHWSDFEQHMISKETEYSVEKVFESKVTGLQNVCESALERANAPVYVFGSVNGYFGGASLVTYSMAGSYADAYCRYRQSKGNSVYCFNWSTWEKTGISAEIPDAVRKASKRSGFESDSAQELLYCFDLMCINGLSNVWLGIDIHNKNYQNKVIGQYQKLLDVFYTGTIEQSVKEQLKLLVDFQTMIQYRKVDAIPNLSNLPNEVDFKELYRTSVLKEKADTNEEISKDMEKMIDIWKEILKVSHISIDDDFFDLGGNSILISKLGMKITEQYGIVISFQDLLENSVLKNLVGKIYAGNGKRAEVNLEQDKKRMYEDLKLKMPFREMLAQAKPAEEIKSVLLTGATGFLGAYLCTSLLKHTKYKILLLVRADCQKKAESRVMANLTTYGLSDCWQKDRIEIICGDLSKEQFGLEEKQYRQLTENVEMIYHAAANVNFVYPYEIIADANVGGMRRILRFAATGVRKIVHQVSSYAVYSAMKRGDVPFDEASELKLELPIQNAYNKTKWVSDMMCEEAAKEGLECVRYRIGTATGDTVGGRCQIRDFFWLLMKICLKLHEIPMVALEFNIIPVDVLADAIVGLSKCAFDSEHTVYNLGFDGIKMDTITKWLYTLDKNFKMVSYSEWVEHLKTYAKEKQEQSILSVLSVFPAEVDWDDISIVDNYTKAVMEHEGLYRKAADYDIFLRTYRYLEQRGFFE